MVMPKKPKERKKSVIVPCRFTEAEISEIRDKASQAGLKVSAFLREAGLGTELRKARRTTPVQEETVRELAKIGSNVNQIARAMNKLAMKETRVDVVRLYAELCAIERELRALRPY